MRLSSAVAAILVLALPAAASAEDASALAHSGFISILPPLVAIAAALVFRQVIPALFVGLWFGAAAVNDLSLEALWTGLLDTVQIYVVSAVANADHAAIIVFTFTIGGMVGIVSRSGGMLGVVNHIAGFASNARRAQLGTAGLGLAIFFDDYTNTLVVGNTMRAVTDRLKVSREKLAYKALLWGSLLGDAVPAGILPTLVFVLAAVTAFATGTSWGTMGILMPLVVPLTWAIIAGDGGVDPASFPILYSAISCVLAGAVWGDHCSPISDTTIMSSIASGCDHIAKVRTQMPYALFVGGYAPFGVCGADSGATARSVFSSLRRRAPD